MVLPARFNSICHIRLLSVFQFPFTCDSKVSMRPKPGIIPEDHFIAYCRNQIKCRTSPFLLR